MGLARKVFQKLLMIYGVKCFHQLNEDGSTVMLGIKGSVDIVEHFSSDNCCTPDRSLTERVRG